MQAMKRWVGVAMLAGALHMLAGCASSPRIEDYAQEKPVLSLKTYFNGDVLANGVFTDRAGRVVKRFTVAMKATWQGNAGVLEEDFVYSDGSKQRRVWRLTEVAPGRFEGRADDVVGVATGESAGNAFHWNYTMALPVDGRIFHVQFDDWMYLMDDRTMINKANMSKWGVHLGEVTLVFTKP